MRIALVHDHLAQNGGAEKVLQAFCELWPEAPVFVIVHDPKHAPSFFHTKDVRTSFIQHLPFGVRRYQWFFPIMPAAIEHFDFSDFDVVLSSSSSFAKGIITRPHTLHIAYCHTPTRFLWSDTHSYIAELRTNRFAKSVLPLLLVRIRIWDRLAAERADNIIANSHVVASRIQKYYQRESTVIHPPVDVEQFHIASPKDIGQFFLAGGRLVPYKRFDFLIDVFNKLRKPLVIFGDGPMRTALMRQAEPNIRFVGRVDDSTLARLYRRCCAFLNPQEEDFGITMIEAMASGRPVIAFRAGGASEIVEHGVHGMLVKEAHQEDFVDALLRFTPNDFDPDVIRARALTFRTEKFKKKIETFVNEQWQNAHSQKLYD